ncbi:MAG: DUF481 domain-containing protein [Planctomycetota bacterium]
MNVARRNGALKSPRCSRPASAALACTASLMLACSLAPADPIEFVLNTGEVLRGEVIARTDSAITMSHPLLGEIVVPVDAVASESPVVQDDVSLADDGADAPPPPPPTEPAAAATVDDPTGDPDLGEPEVVWESRFDAGFAVSSGNTDTQEFTAGVSSLREAIRTRTTLDARYFYGASDGDRDTNKATVAILNDWLFTDSRWSYFISGQADYDEFQSWEYRASIFTGFGYELIQQEDLELRLRAGIGATREFNSQRNQIIPEALLGAELAWDINDRQNLEAATTLFPDLDDTGEYRLVSSASWVLALDEDRDMNFSLGLLNEYQSKVDPGIENNDLKVFGSFGFSF